MADHDAPAVRGDDWRWTSAFSIGAAQEIGIDRLQRQPNLVPTGLPGIDRQFWYWGCRQGIPRGEYVVVGGASNVGKTQFGLHLVKQAVKHGERAAVFSLEMRREDILVRLHQGATDIESKHWSPNHWTPEHGQKLVKDVLRYGGERIREEVLVNAGYSSELHDVLGELRAVIDDGVKFVLVDHLQLIRVNGKGDDEIATRAEMVSESLRRVAIERDVTIVGLSQLNRFASRERGRSPSIHDLWGGTSMESNPSIILLLDHSRYERDPMQPHIARTWITLAKNRMGPKDLDVPVQWNHQELTLLEATPEEADYRWPKHEKAA